jgi:hypothetical protein
MKTVSYLALATLIGFATACQKDIVPASPEVNNPNPLTKAFFENTPYKSSIKNASSVNLTGLADSKETTKFTVSLLTAAGQPVEKDADLQPNTVYQVLVQSQSPASFVLKMAESFDVIQRPALSEALRSTYLIKTNADIPPQLYLSVVPVHVKQRVLTKEHPVGFLLPN